MKKRILAIALSALLMLSCAFSASAAVVLPKRNWSPYVTVDNVTATANDTVLVNVELSGNTYGIMAVTFSVIYDESALSYVKFYPGVFSEYYVVKKSGYIAIVDCESQNMWDDGTIITLEFKVKETANGGTYPIKVGHVRPNEKGESLKDCFANWRGDNISPVVTNGSLTIPITQQNCRHNYSGWTVKAEAGCASEGAEVRNCDVCGKSESRTLPKTEHIYENDWTIDTAATKDSDGVMSRHCKGCSKKTDYVYFPYSIVADSGFKNTVGDKVTATERELLESYEGTETPPVDDAPEPDTPSTQVNPPPDGVLEENEIPDDANALISDKRQEEPQKNGIAGKLFCYLFGADGEGGIINAIIKAFKQFVQNLFG